MYNFVKVKFPESAVQPHQVHMAVYRQKLFEHDYAQITLRDWGFNPKQVKPGSLMQLTFDKKEYFGYVHDIRTRQESGKHLTTIGFIGASYVMKQASRKIYVNTTADQIVASIAKKYNFAYKAIPHPRIFDQVSQAGMTDWELMVKLAKQCGYSLRAENTELYFQPILQDFKDLHEEALSFRKSDGGYKSSNLLYKFESVVSETMEHEFGAKAATSVSGVDPFTGKSYSYTVQDAPQPTRDKYNQEFFDKHAVGTVAPGYSIGVYEAYAARTHNYHPHLAHAEVLGDANIRPGIPVFLYNIGPDYTGYWHVLGVEHVMLEEDLNKHVFTSQLIVGTDSLGVYSQKDAIKKPLSKPIRKIIPNIRNTVIKPKTYVSSQSLRIKPVREVALIDKLNKPNTSGPLVNRSNWSSSHGSLLLVNPLTNYTSQAITIGTGASATVATVISGGGTGDAGTTTSVSSSSPTSGGGGGGGYLPV